MKEKQKEEKPLMVSIPTLVIKHILNKPYTYKFVILKAPVLKKVSLCQDR